MHLQKLHGSHLAVTKQWYKLQCWCPRNTNHRLQWFSFRVCKMRINPRQQAVHRQVLSRVNYTNLTCTGYKINTLFICLMTESNDIHGNSNLNSKCCDWAGSLSFQTLPPQQVNYSLKLKKNLSHHNNATKSVLAEKDECQEGNKTFLLHSVFLDKQNLEVLQ